MGWSIFIKRRQPPSCYLFSSRFLLFSMMNTAQDESLGLQVLFFASATSVIVLAELNRQVARMSLRRSLLWICLLASWPHASANDFFDRYFAAKVKGIEASARNIPATKDDYLAHQSEQRRELASMLGLDPMPERSPLEATVTDQFEHEGIVVENLHFQSRPGLYVTANLYRPLKAEKPLPAVLYLCGHADKKKDGISYGNKAGYEHHGVWYAKQGFVCLMLDTVQLGEIRGEHHGTFHMGKWWWISRGYTPAGVEAWAGIRGLDYLETRKEVDPKRLGVTGRSGGGAYSWWVAALDERVACAAPTAGITTLHDHVVDGRLSGHCDCMYLANDERWDYAQVASLVAPRPLLIVNTDKDEIFPIDGVFNLFKDTREAYRVLGAEENLGFHVAEGGHQDVQPLYAGELHWMLRHLQNQPAALPFEGAAPKSIPMEKLRVFTSLPTDEKNTTIDQTFVPAAAPVLPENEGQWSQWKAKTLDVLNARIFPMPKETIAVRQAGQSSKNGITTTRYVLSSDQPDLSPDLDLVVLHRDGTKPGEFESITLRIVSQEEHEKFAEELKNGSLANAEGLKPGSAIACFSPRGIGATARAGTDKELIHFKRRFYLIGETLEANQVTDIRHTLGALKPLLANQSGKLAVTARGAQGINAVYASLLDGNVERLELSDPPATHMAPDAPAYLNILKHIDIPQAVALVSETSKVSLHGAQPEAWSFPIAVADRLKWSAERNGLQLDGAGDSQ
jgi:dienelactone hydrolase